MALPEPSTVYNLEVEGAHTFFVGEVGVWAHNNCGDEIPQAERAGLNGFQGPVQEVNRPARYGGGPALKRRYPDGSVRDRSRKRVKETVLNRHRKAPDGKALDITYNNAILGAKRKKRPPTADEIGELRDF